MVDVKYHRPVRPLHKQGEYREDREARLTCRWPPIRKLTLGSVLKRRRRDSILGFPAVNRGRRANERKCLYV